MNSLVQLSSSCEICSLEARRLEHSTGIAHGLWGQRYFFVPDDAAHEDSMMRKKLMNNKLNANSGVSMRKTLNHWHGF